MQFDTSEIELFLTRWNYWCQELHRIEYSIIQAITFNPNLGPHIDHTAVEPWPSWARLTEAQKYARTKLVDFVFQPPASMDATRLKDGALSEVYRMFKNEAVRMGKADDPRVPVLAASMAGYTNLSQTAKRSLSARSALFEKIEEEIQWKH